jgi:hypothetical protein
MRMPSSESGKEGRACCISSTPEGQIRESFPVLSQPHSARPVPNFFYDHRLFDSENTGTAIAQIGRVVPLVGPYEEVENRRWHAWLRLPTSPVASHVAVEGSRASLEHRVSPSVSQICQPREEIPYLPLESDDEMVAEPRQLSDKETQEDLPSSSVCTQIFNQYEEWLARLHRLEQFVESGSCDKQHEDLTKHSPEEPSDTSFATTAQETLLVNSFEEQSNLEVTGDGHTRDGSSNAHEKVTSLVNPANDTSSPSRPLVLQKIEPTSNNEDPEEAWKAFVFGEEQSEEIRDEVFEEAKQEAARNLHRPRQLADSTEASESGATTAATIGTAVAHHASETSEYTETSPSVESLEGVQSTSFEESMKTESRPHIEDDSTDIPSTVTHMGCGGSSPVSVQEPEILETLTTQSVDDVTSDSQAGPPTTNMSMAVLPPLSEVKAIEDEVTSDSPSGPPSMTTSMAVVPAQSEAGLGEQSTVKEPFRFAQPKLFVGSRSNLAQLPIIQEPSYRITLTKRRRTRAKKRANDGRADIRALPNYSSDPIEDFEEDRQVRRGGRRTEKSRFPALELS